MCYCTPEVRTPCCGKPGCHPKAKIEIQDAKPVDWINTETGEEFYGIKVKVDNQWKFYAENSKPVFGTFKEMQIKCRELLGMPVPKKHECGLCDDTGKMKSDGTACIGCDA